MKRIVMLLLCTSLLVGLVVPAAALPVSDLTALAQYYPAKTVFFASIRTDDAFIDSMDALLARIMEAVPEADLGGQTFRGALNDIFDDNPNLDGTFDELVRSWLGDTAAFGAPSTTELFDSERSNDDETPVLIALEVTDRAAAAAFFDDIIPPDVDREAELIVEETETYTLLTPPDTDNPAAIYIGEDVMLITNQRALLPSSGMTNSLSTSDDFTNGLSRLPESDYNALAYINLPEIMTHLPVAQLEPEEAAVLASLSPLYQAVGGQVIGATLLDDRSLALDYVQPITDLDAYEAFGVTVTTEYTPVSFDFARYIPAGTPLVLQGADLQTVYDNFIASLTAAASLQENFTAEGAESPIDQIEGGMRQIQFAIAGLTGLNLEEEILSWMTGNYALAFRLSPALSDLSSSSDFPTSFPMDFSLLIEATDPEAAQALVDGLAQSLTYFDDEFEVSTDEIGSSTVQVITVPTSSDVPFPIEIVFGASEDVFVFGTPRMAEAALNPGEGLAGDASYVEMQSYTLENPVNIYYLAGEGLTPLVNLLVLSNAVNAWDEDAIGNVFRLVSSSSISWNIQADGTSIYRMVLTLPE